VQRIEAACRERAQSRILIAEDAQGRAHAGCYLVWDSESAYYLLGGGDPELRNSGAMSLVMWEAIRFSAEVSDSFDFEGSMIESIERFFRAFGALQTPTSPYRGPAAVPFFSQTPCPTAPGSGRNDDESNGWRSVNNHHCHYTPGLRRRMALDTVSGSG
jgi:hypothetical protein